MQKRSLVFLFILTASMLVVNLFFKPKVENKADPKKNEIIAKNTLESRVATQSGLPLVDIYKDSDAKTYLNSGLLFNGQVLTLKWDENLPNTIYFKKSHSSEKLQEAKLNTPDSELNAPILFQANNASKTLLSAELPSKGSFEIQLLHPKAYHKNPQIFTTFFSKGALASLGEINGNAIAVTQSDSGYEPVGIYVGKEARFIPIQEFFNLKSSISSHKLALQTNSVKEQFYILENDHEQLVFSNIGGALAEINLRTKSKEFPNSPVFSTSEDAKYVKEGSKQALFPAHPFFKDTSSNEENAPTRGGYYPLIRRSLDSQETQPRYYAFNLVSDNPALSELPYKVTHFDSKKIVFEAKQAYRKITKTFTLDSSKPYALSVDVKVEGDKQNLWLTGGVPEAESGASPLLKARYPKNNKFEITKVKLPKTSADIPQNSIDWLSNSNGFFTLLINPQTSSKTSFKVQKVTGNDLSSRVDSQGKKNPGYEVLIPLSDQQETLLNVYTGPLENHLLTQAQGNDSSLNYSQALSYHGFLSIISEPCAKILFTLLNLIHKFTSSWGLSIILLTVALRLLLYPLNSWSINAMRKNQEIAPEVSAIQKKYKNNPKQAQIEVMQLYRKRKVNPITGCLPMLIQMPLLMGMFGLLRSSFVLRGVPFIRGWIDNLTAPDVLFSWSKSIPFFGNEFHFLPLISFVILWVQQRMSNTMPTDKSQMTDQQKQQKMMGNVMLIFMTLVCYNMPSGLNLYFIFSTLLGVVQQWITNRLLDKKKNKPTIISKSKTALKQKQV